MKGPKTIISDVPFDVFNEFVSTLRDKLKIINHVRLHYDGTEIRGTVEIQQCGDYAITYKEAIKAFVDINCK